MSTPQRTTKKKPVATATLMHARSVILRLTEDQITILGFSEDFLAQCAEDLRSIALRCGEKGLGK
jgi:hypothetical protein